MKTLSHPDLSRLTASTQSFLFLTAFIAVWGEAVALAYFVFHAELSLLALALMLEAVVWVITATVQAQVRSNRGENLVLIGTALVVTVTILCSLPFLADAVPAAFIPLLIAVRFAAHTYRQHALAYIGPIYAARHRRNALVNRIVAGRGLAGLAMLGLVLLARTDAIIIMMLIWLVAIALHLVMALWLEQAAEEFETQSPEGGAYTYTLAGRPSLTQLVLVWQNKLSRWLSLCVLSIAFLSNLLLFQAAQIVAEWADTIQDAVYFYAFSGAVGLWVTLPISYRLLSQVLRRHNAGQVIWLYPGALLLAVLAIGLVPFVALAFLSEIIRHPLRMTLHTPLQRLLYRALPESEQVWTKRLWQSVVDPAGRFVSGGLLLALGTTSNAIPVVGVGVGVLFLLTAFRAGRLYGKTLQTSIQDNNYRLLRQTTDDLTTSDQVFIEELLSRIQAGIDDERELLHVVEVVSESELDEAYDTLCELWQTSHEALKAELLPYIIDAWPDKSSEQANRALIQQALESTHTPLRQQALTMIARYPQLDPEDSIARFLIDPDPKVDVVAAWILLRHPSLQVRHAARAQLRWLARDNSVAIRVTAVSALINGSLNSFGELVHPLNIAPYMNDPATRVREAALPAATIPQLIEAACDPSNDVRQVAIQQLDEHRFQRSLQQLIAAVEEQETIVVSTNYLQIEASLRYWRLLSAARQLSWRPSHQRLLEDLREGFEQIDILNSISLALYCLDREAFEPVIKQIERDRDDLLNIMIWNLGTHIGQTETATLMWVLRAGVGTAEYNSTRRTLAKRTTPLIADKFVEALAPKAEDNTSLQSPLPTIAFEVLLAQRDEWRPLLTLFTLSRLPLHRRQNWAAKEDIEQVITRSLNSSSGVVRESGRLIKRLLADGQGGQRPYNLDSHLQQDEKERLLMLSTLERMLFLRNVSFFENLHLDQLRALARGCQEITAPEGEIIVKQGTVGNSLFVVVEGRVRVEFNNADGATTVLSHLGVREVFGEISLLDGSLRSANVVAETPVLLLSIHREALNTALEDDPNIAMVMLQSLAQRLRQNNEMLGNRPQPHADN